MNLWLPDSEGGQLDHSILDGCLSFNLAGKNVIGDWDVYGKIR